MKPLFSTEWERLEYEKEHAPPCPKCSAKTEHWWSYCAMCGYHIAGGTLAPSALQEQVT